LKDASPIVAPHDRGVSVAFRIGETEPFLKVEADRCAISDTPACGRMAESQGKDASIAVALSHRY